MSPVEHQYSSNIFEFKKLCFPTVHSLVHNPGTYLPHQQMCRRPSSTQSLNIQGDNMNEVIRAEYFLSLVDSAELANLLAFLEEGSR